MFPVNIYIYFLEPTSNKWMNSLSKTNKISEAWLSCFEDDWRGKIHGVDDSFTSLLPYLDDII